MPDKENKGKKDKGKITGIRADKNQQKSTKWREVRKEERKNKERRVRITKDKENTEGKRKETYEVNKELRQK